MTDLSCSASILATLSLILLVTTYTVMLQSSTTTMRLDRSFPRERCPAQSKNVPKTRTSSCHGVFGRKASGSGVLCAGPRNETLIPGASIGESAGSMRFAWTADLWPFIGARDP